MFVSHLYVFGEMSVQFFGPFIDWAYFSDIELHELGYIFEINSLAVASFAIIFSLSEGCLFTFQHRFLGPKTEKASLRESESESHSVVSDSLQPHGLYIPWNSLGHNTGAGVGTLSLL